MMARVSFGICFSLLPIVCQSQELTLPNAARLLSDRTSALDSYELPVAPFANGTIPNRKFEGRIERNTWRINGTAATTLQLLSPLRDQLEAIGYEIVLECEDNTCGGFDFRFGTEVVPAPDMHVDIGNYRFLSAVREPDQAISILISRSGNTAYFQIIRITPSDQKSRDLTASPRSETGVPGNTERPGDIGDSLEAQGHVILADLSFDSGAGALLPGPHPSLSQLAAYLGEHPDQRIALVGHTDSTGSLDVNIALSKQRAEAVRRRLIEDFDIDPARVDAEGMGYLAPIASNLTREGREANRRVEAILLSNS